GYDEDNWWPNVLGFRNLGSRVVKYHLAPQTMQKSGLFLGGDRLRRYVDRTAELGMIIMSHIGDPDAWYDHPDRYGSDPDFWGTREEHYEAWEALLDQTRGHPWWGAHLGGWPENPKRLRHLLSTYPDLMLDLSATKWMVREVSARRDELRAFVIEFQDRLMWGSDQVSQTLRSDAFYASRWWCHRKLWESGYDGPSLIADPDAPNGEPVLRGLDLAEDVLTKLYRTNITRLMACVGVSLPG
ncbi:MAG: amidohydrolase family protein, partial [Planctomycetota bacterium]